MLKCPECIIAAHATLLLHHVEVSLNHMMWKWPHMTLLFQRWNGQFFDKDSPKPWTVLSGWPLWWSLPLPSHWPSDGKVWFSSVQRGNSLNLELNSRFGSGHFAEPRTGPTVQVRFRFKPVWTLGVWETYFWPLFQSKSLENVNIHLIYLILDRGRLPCYDFCLINGC